MGIKVNTNSFCVNYIIVGLFIIRSRCLNQGRRVTLRPVGATTFTGGKTAGRFFGHHINYDFLNKDLYQRF